MQKFPRQIFQGPAHSIISSFLLKNHTKMYNEKVTFYVKNIIMEKKSTTTTTLT